MLRWMLRAMSESLRDAKAQLREAKRQIRELKSEVAHYRAGCHCTERPYCGPHGWAGTDVEWHAPICADHEHYGIAWEK